MTRSAGGSALLSILFAILVGSVAFGEPTKGPLRVHPKNPRYFADVTGKAVYLTGAHTWNNLPDMSEISKLAAAGGPTLSKLQTYRPPHFPAEMTVTP